MGNMFLKKNGNFQFIKFYLQNNKKINPNIINKSALLNYNIHNFINMNKEINIINNMNNILNFVRIYSEKLPLVVFQELNYQNINHKRYFEKNMKKMGYNWFYVFNGSYDRNIVGSSILALFFKKVVKRINGVTIKITKLLKRMGLDKLRNDFNTNIRNMIIADTIYGKILCVHLPIGLRDIKLQKVRQINSTVRKFILQELTKVLDPDIIVGDFNMTKGDKEYKYLQTKYLVQNSNKNSTPYNRVDYIWFKKNNIGEQRVKKRNTLVEINYSDHLPMIQEL